MYMREKNYAFLKIKLAQERDVCVVFTERNKLML